VASGVEIRVNGEYPSALHPADCQAGPTDVRQDLIRRVVSSSTFEKSPKLRAFLLYVCRCALDNEPAAATEQQIGIHVFGRPPGYNPNEDNIVRSQARLLRLKLEHHFACEGNLEPVVITIPKGRYLPAFEKRPDPSAVRRPESVVDLQTVSRKTGSRSSYLRVVLLVLSVVLGLAIVWVFGVSLGSKISGSSHSPSGPVSSRPDVTSPVRDSQLVTAPVVGEVRIAAGNTGSAYIDGSGRRWESDQFYHGGVSGAGPEDLFPPVADPNPFKTVRQGAATESSAPQAHNEFRYDIPVKPGVYELRLYFADPVRHSTSESGEDAQNLRHFQVNLNERPLLVGFDAIADAGSAPVDIRAFKDVSPAADGKVHLNFMPAAERPFVSAIELTPGIPGKLKPIRVSARKADFVDGDGTRWSADNYFINGHTMVSSNSDGGPKIPELYTVERYGNFSYAIPVPPGSYTIKLHFMESFFGAFPNGLCNGAGCRVFDVTCNGVMLLQDFDVFKAAGGALRPLVRTFRHLHPNGQGKLVMWFSPKVNYAEVRAIEVIDETQ
jgi:Malectin domain